MYIPLSSRCALHLMQPGDRIPYWVDREHVLPPQNQQEITGLKQEETGLRSKTLQLLASERNDGYRVSFEVGLRCSSETLCVASS